MKKRLISAAIVLAALIITLSVYVYVQKNSSTGSADMRYYYQTDLHFYTDDGFYFLDADGLMQFYDYAAAAQVVVCNKPNCRHETWNDLTPDEQKCHAYIPSVFTQAGFVVDDQLYVMESTSDGKDILSITVSGLDRSGQRVIAELESSSTYSFVVKEQMLYVTSLAHIYEEEEDGTLVWSGEQDTWVNAVDLQTGAVTEISERLRAVNSEIQILGVSDDMIYIGYSYYANGFDGTNFAESGYTAQLHTYNMADGNYEVPDIAAAENMIFTRSYGNKIAGYLYEEPYQLVIYDVATKATTRIDEFEENLAYFDECIVYTRGNSRYYYNVAEERITEISDEFASLYINADAGTYLYGVKTEPGDDPELVHVMLLKEDFYHNNPDYQYLDW